MGKLRRLLAAECGFAALVTAGAVVFAGISPWAFALLAVCALAAVPAVVVINRVARHGPHE